MILPFLFSITAADMPFLSPVFGDHMVLQRDKPNTFWGWTKPGERVGVSIKPDGTAVAFNTLSASGIADSTGKWVVKMTPPKVGGPYKVEIGDAVKVMTLKDVLVGDVWVCSGQSNMEMGISQARDPQTEIANANYPNIRLMAVPKSPSLTPRPFVKAEWLACTPENIVKGGWGGFSAVAYYFGRHLNKELNVPIGLVHTSWGGTPAEAWTSTEGIAPVKDFQKQVDAVNEMNQPGALHTPDLVERWVNDNGENYSSPTVDASSWNTVALPARFGQIGLTNHRGVVWFRKTFELPDPVPAGDAYLTTGSNDGVDMNYVNGVRSGSGSSVLNWRQAKLSVGVLKPGTNTIAIRFVGTSPNAGFTFPGLDGFNLRIGGTVVPLAGKWHMKKGIEIKDAKQPMPMLVEDNPNWPTTLHNGMLYPLMPLGIKGAIWYQGESNIGRGEQYSRLLPAMITDWRAGFGQGDFPFFVVQLANFGRRNPEPTNSGWAELREAQATAITRVKNAGLAVTADIGEAADIHPKNKQDVGLRLALNALKIAYGKKVEYSGPTFKKATPGGSAKYNTPAGQTESKSLTVSFDHASGLTIKSEKHSGFAIAGADEKFFWADAVVVGNAVRLSSEKVVNPIYVRYAWDDDPVMTLFNEEGLPAVPFRTK